jgi:hypothetical protein
VRLVLVRVCPRVRVGGAGAERRVTVTGIVREQFANFFILFFKKLRYVACMTDQDALKAKYDYDPETGIFRRKTSWGKQKAGDEAGCVSPQGYRYLSFFGRATPAHRLAWLWMYGAWPPADVDHLNRDRLDNRIANLRSATRSENCHNVVARGISGLKGVYPASKGASWNVRIMVKRKQIYLGSYATAEEAAAARKGAEYALGLCA